VFSRINIIGLSRQKAINSPQRGLNWRIEVTRRPLQYYKNTGGVNKKGCKNASVLDSRLAFSFYGFSFSYFF